MEISFLVYGFMIMAFFLLGAYDSQGTIGSNGIIINSRNRRFWTMPIFLTILIFVFFAAVRWQVGVDHLNYKASYDFFYRNGYFSRNDIEVSYRIIVKTLSSFGLSSVSFFAVYAFIQIYLIYYRFKDDRYLYPYLGLLLVCLSFISMMNGMRQWVAACIFILSTKYIFDRKFIKYLLCMYFAVLFHRSAAILVPFYFLPNKAILNNRNINLILLIGSALIGLNPFWFNAVDKFVPVLEALGYDNYADNVERVFTDNQRDMSFGLQRGVLFLLPILVVLYNSKLVQTFAHRGYNLFFNLMMINVIWFNLFANTSHLFLRPNLYFNFFPTIATSFLMVYLKRVNPRTSINKMVFMCIIICAIAYITWACYTGPRAEVDFQNYKFLFNNL